MTSLDVFIRSETVIQAPSPSYAGAFIGLVVVIVLLSPELEVIGLDE
jgi:hypothetical protein